jgi:hypothetical protein
MPPWAGPWITISTTRLRAPLVNLPAHSTATAGDAIFDSVVPPPTAVGDEGQTDANPE